MRLENKTICITGAAGFLGSHLCVKLLSRGAKIIALDNYSIGTPKALDKIKGDITICDGDIRSIDSIRSALNASDAVFHLAAIANPRTCYNDFRLAFEVNVQGTANVLEVSKHVERVMFLSSIMVYGEPRYLPIDEKHPTAGTDPYAASKMICEHLVQISNTIDRTPYTIIRNSNSYGPDQSSDYLTPTLILQALNEGPVEIWDPRTIRDFLYVEDTVEALTRMLETESTAGEVINLGAGLGISAGELADIICDQTGTEWIDVNRPSPVSSKLIADTSRLRALTGWQPQTSLEEGIAHTIEHYKTTLPCTTK